MKFLFIIFFLISACTTYNVDPDTTTIEVGSATNKEDQSENSKVKQTWKWSKKKSSSN